MNRQHLLERVEAVADLAISTADRAAIMRGLADAERVRRWLAARDVLMRERLAELSAWPEQHAAEATGADLREAERLAHRADLLGKVPGLREALERGAVAPEHLDALDRFLRSLDDLTRGQLLARCERVVELALGCSPRGYRKRLQAEAARLRSAAAEEDRLARQEQACRLRLWIDEVTGMVHLAGAFDPLAGMALWNALDATVDALHADGARAGEAPTDPRDRQEYLRAIALLGLTGVVPLGGSEERAFRPPGRPTAVVVVDATPDEHGIARVDWGLPVELPLSVLQRILRDGALRTIMIRNGIVVDPTGALDRGRSQRLGTAEQRLALNALYPTCAVPGCSVPFARCKLHHVTAWEDGGPTDLDNLLPVCVRHHHAIHDRGWQLHLTADRVLTIAAPDGARVTTGPPARAA